MAAKLTPQLWQLSLVAIVAIVAVVMLAQGSTTTMQNSYDAENIAGAAVDRCDSRELAECFQDSAYVACSGLTWNEYNDCMRMVDRACKNIVYGCSVE